MARVLIEFPAQDGTRLAGTLTVPSAPGLVAGALLLSGSDPLDRDSNMPPAATRPPRPRSPPHWRRTASRRCASTSAGVGGSGGEYVSAGFPARAARPPRCAPPHCAGRLRSTRSASRSPATRLGRRSRFASPAPARGADPCPDAVLPLAGIVLLASGAARPGAAVMALAVRSHRRDAPASAAARLGRLFPAALQARGQRRLRASTADVIQGHTWTRNPARWMREYMAYDPAPDLAAIRCPVLADHRMQGRPGRRRRLVDRMRQLVGAPFTGQTPADLTARPAHYLRPARPCGLPRAAQTARPDPALMGGGRHADPRPDLLWPPPREREDASAVCCSDRTSGSSSRAIIATPAST